MKRLSKIPRQILRRGGLTAERPAFSGRLRVMQILSALFMVSLTGCSTLYKRIDPGIDVEQAMFAPQETHFFDVLDELGPPCRFTKMPGGFAMMYEDMLIRELQTGISGRTGWLQLLKFSVADSNLYRDVILFRFDSQGRLVSKAISDAREDLGKSGSIQPILSLEQLVDTRDYEDDAVESVAWGMDLLRPLPQALNNRQSLNSGYAGLEQSGTTTKVGQHTLEMR